jgi:hypothetical protein
MSVSAATYVFREMLARRHMPQINVVGVCPNQHVLIFIPGHTLEESRTGAIAANSVYCIRRLSLYGERLYEHGQSRDMGSVPVNI